MKLPTDPRIPVEQGTLRQRLTDLFRDSAQQVNALSEGKLVANYSATVGPPTTGTHRAGDVVRNSEPTEGGVAPNTYVLYGWICIASGTPGTWKQMRVPTDDFGGGGGGGSTANFGAVVDNNIDPPISVQKLLPVTIGSATYYIELMGN